jgi:replicative DNA helicase
MKTWKLEAEVQAMLSVLQSPDEVKNTLVSLLTEEHFAYDQMVLSFDVYSKLIKKTTQLPSMETFMQSPGVTAEAIEALKLQGVSPITKVDDAHHLVGVLNYYRKARKALELAMTITAKMKPADALPNMDDLVLDMEKALTSMNQGANEQKIIHIGKGHNSDYLLEELLNGEQPKLIPSTFTNFDIKVGGFGCTDFVILASHAKGGKSLTSLNMIVNQYRLHNLNVVLVSMEMRDFEVRDRLMSLLTGIEHTKIRTKTLNKLEQEKCRVEWQRFKEHGEKNNCRFTIWDTVPGLTTAEVKLHLKNRGYDVICIDYINLMEAAERGLPDWQRLSVLGRELKQATKELTALIIAPTQMNDDGDVRYSKALKEHANTIWRWFYKEEQRATHLIRVDQLVVRGWEAFPFMLREDMSRSLIMDGPTVVPEKEQGNNRKEELKRMYKED